MAFQNLELCPPIPGNETIYGWYPPAYSQYEKHPLKSLAVLDDYSKFYGTSYNMDHTINNIKNDPKVTPEPEGTVLSTRLNAIRQELTRKRINVKKFQKNFSSVKQYMNVPEGWTTRYPDPDLQLLTEAKINTVSSKSAPPKTVTEKIEVQKYQNQQPVEENLRRCNTFTTFVDNRSCNNEKNVKSLNVKTASTVRPNTALGVKTTNKCVIGSSSNNKLKQHNSDLSNLQRPTVTSATLSTNNNDNLFLTNENRMKQISRSDSYIPASLSNYEKDLNKYQWLMQVHGDPFNIKKPYIPKKESLVFQLPDVQILPMEPPMVKQNRNTFFYNTSNQCGKAATFDINPHFSSERYNTTKNKLRSKDQWKYSYKSFSFVY